MRVSHRQLINSNPPPLNAEGDFFMHGMMKILNNINKELLREKSEN